VRRFRGLRRIVGVFLGLGILLAGAAGLAGFTAYEKFSADLPSVAGLRTYQPPVMSRIYAGNGQLMAELATERRIFVPYAAIPELVKQAFLSAEDQNFFKHGGVDPLAILRASLTDLANMGQGRRPLGASTITQQVAKNMLLANNEVSLSRKLREALLAIRIEQTLSKQRILEIYLNEIYLGLQSYGVAAAAQAYFNKPLDQLTVAEAAFLAALPKAPNNYNPFRFPDAARARRDWVIDRMADDHAITPDQAREAKATPIVPAPFHRPELPAGTDWFTEEARRQLVAEFGADAATQGGLAVRTSLDPALQAAADRALRDGLMAYDRAHGGWRGPVAHVDPQGVTASGWATASWVAALSQVARPPGMLGAWQLAVVTSETDADAKLGWLQPGSNGAPAVPGFGVMRLADLAWARPVRNGQRGPAPRRMSDVVRPGDVVMAEFVPGAPAAGKTPARPDRFVLRQIPQVEGAIVSLDPASGRVLAISGGWSFETSQFDRATQAQRQPGSSFKPMVYLTALERGISPSQQFLDAPFVQNLGAAGMWRPGNYEGTFNGPTSLRVALEQSLNLVTIRVADAVGMDAVAQTAKAFHVVDSMPLVLPAALGAVDTTVLRQAGAYASLAEYGREVLPSFIDSVQDRDGNVIWHAPGLACQACGDPNQMPVLQDQRKQIADPQSVFQLITMMQGVVTHGTGTAAGQGLGREIAGKTGTSQDFNDAWFVGFTPDLVTAVWVGFDQPQSLGDNETGGAIAAPIWHDFMAVALKDRPKLSFPMPDGLTMSSWQDGSGTVTDAFKPGQQPGASVGIASADSGATPTATAGATTGGGLDSGMGGLY
jgi:penicillin-binding protein 1A